MIVWKLTLRGNKPKIQGGRKMKLKKLLSVALISTMTLGLLSGCGGSSTEESTSSTGEETTTDTVVADGDKEVIEFWYHDGNTTSTPMMEELISRFEEEYPQYTVDYVGLPADSYVQKYTTAVATGEVPDVISIIDMSVATFVNQDALMNLDDVFEEFEEKDNINAEVIDNARSYTTDGGLYVIPEYVTVEVAWANTTLMEEKGAEIPTTISEFMTACEEYADPDSGEYFYSLRGGSGSTENTFAFLFTYAGQNELFDEEGNCVLDQPIFAEALDLYASIYWNGWTSQDSVANGFQEMVAEFGSGTSMYISHNVSSLSEHQTNLGEGNFTSTLPLSDDDGNIVAKAGSFIGFSIMEEADNKEGAIAFLEFITSAESSSYICQTEGRVPINDLIYEEEWYQEDEYLAVAEEILTSDSVSFMVHPMWLTDWFDFRDTYQDPGVQAVLLKERTSEEVLQ